MVQVIPSSYIASYCFECLLLGINCVLYGFCAYTLWGQKSLSCRVLLVVNTLQFLLCAAQIIVHATFLLVVFTILTEHVQAYLRHVNPYFLTASIIFNVNYAIGNLLSIWRLYFLYDNNLKICFPALIFWIGQICSSIFAVYSSIKNPLVKACFTNHAMLWVFLTALSLYVAIAICLRLCIAQKRTHTVLSSSLIKSIAIVLVECSALIAVCNLVGITFNTRKSIYSLLSLGSNTEVVVASSLLLTARHAMLSQSRYSSSQPPTTIMFKDSGTGSSQIDTSMTQTGKGNMGSLQSLADG